LCGEITEQLAADVSYLLEDTQTLHVSGNFVAIWYIIIFGISFSVYALPNASGTATNDFDAT
jgi:hypothetical protein